MECKNFEEKVAELQAEIQLLDGKCSNIEKTTTILFGSAIATPFVFSSILYLISPKFVMTDNQTDRKKIVKWTILLTILVWLGMYLYSSIHLKK